MLRCAQKLHDTQSKVQKKIKENMLTYQLIVQCVYRCFRGRMGVAQRTHAYNLISTSSASKETSVALPAGLAAKGNDGIPCI